uniref:PABC domain-containing protein n=1 Tax=Lepisosteus oculatus TaxID=7918 RepID=W5M5H2_LEPOC
MEDDEEELDLLGEKLYTLLYPRHTEMAGKLTGMLLELPSSVIKEMLQDERMLSEGVEKALTALRQLAETGKTEPYVEDGTSISTDSQGDQLYELVDVYNTGYTEQITGMLLEQKKEDVQKLLSDPSLLEEKVTIALKSLEEQKQMESEASDSSESDVKER